MNICYVIGFPIEQSLSPLIHNAGFNELNLDFNFIKQSVKQEDLVSAINSIKIFENIKGISVTIPHKVNAFNLVNKVTDEASQIGAINTIYKDNGLVIGTNTDWYGIYLPITENINFSSRNVLLIGAGGASRSAIYALKKLDCNIYLKARNSEKAKKLALEFNINILENENTKIDFDLLINATPLGMYPNINEISVSEELLHQANAVFDLIYNPIETKLIKTAKKLNKKIIFGTEMFLYQAVKQFEIYTGLKAPIEAMRKVLLEKLNDSLYEE